jgi:molybdopterin synthase sulfur carrier subunit
MLRILLPSHLRSLARLTTSEVHLDVPAPLTQRTLLDALETRYPMLRGTLRDQHTQKRRPMVRFFACKEDLSHESPDALLPDAVASGAEPFCIIGAIAGG